MITGSSKSKSHLEASLTKLFNGLTDNIFVSAIYLTSSVENLSLYHVAGAKNSSKPSYFSVTYIFNQISASSDMC